MTRLATTFFALAILAGAALPAFAQARFQFDLPAQPLEETLRAVARTTGTNVLFEPQAVKGKSAKPIKGQLTAEEALNRVVSDTSLEVRRSNESTLVVRDKAPGGASPNPTLLAQAQTETDRAGASDSSDVKKAERLTVTGSRLPRIEEERVQPVVVFDREAMERTGAKSLQELLRYVPQASINNLAINGDTNTIQLRGLPIGTTLVLVNGRRMSSSAVQSAINFFDLNNIPLSILERVEILASGASAVYGADALAGVINIITRKSFEGAEASVGYGATDDGHAAQKRANLSAGGAFAGVRGFITLDYRERETLLGKDRPRLANNDYTRFGGTDFRQLPSNPPNVYSLNGQNLPGLNVTSAAAPSGFTGTLRPSDFLPGAVNRANTFGFSSVIPESERAAAFGRAEYDLTRDVTLFVELFASRAQTMSVATPLQLSNGRLGNFRVAAANPFNPFGVDVGIDYLFEAGGGLNTGNEAFFKRGLVGAQGALGERWNWELGFLATGDRGKLLFLNQINQTALRAALAQSNPALALNPFGNGPVASPEVLASLRTSTLQRFGTEASQIDASVTGTLPLLPAGDLRVVVGGEARREEINFGGFNPPIQKDRDARAVFAEVLVPIVGGRFRPIGVGSVVATAAARHDDYSDFGKADTYQVGLEVRPVPALLLRASQSTSFKPPSFFQLYQPQSTAQLSTIDPARGNEQLPVTQIFGGNPDLQPEEGKSANVGVVFETQSGRARGLLISADWFRVELDKRISTSNAITLLANESFFASRVVRSVPTPADVAAGRPGQLVSVDVRAVNFGLITVTGVDLRFNYRFLTPIGQLSPSLNATYIKSYEAGLVPGAAPTERVGVFATDSWSPKWKAVGSLFWSRGPLEAGVSARYTHHYRGEQTGASQRTVRSHTEIDLNASYSTDKNRSAWPDLLRNTKVSVGVTNLFDREPPFFNGFSGYDQTQASVVGRFIYVDITKRF